MIWLSKWKVYIYLNNMSEFKSDISWDRNKDQLLNQKELEKQKEQITLLTKLQLWFLSDDVISSYLSKNHGLDLNNFDEINKKRFLEEIRFIFSEFKDFDESMVTRLKEIRENMSFWLENWKSNDYYIWMILSNKINTRILVLQESLKTINWERIKVWNTEYNKDEYGSFKTWIQDLDIKNWLNLFSKVDLENYWFDFKQGFVQEIKWKVDKSNPKYNLIISDLNRLSQVIWEKWFENLKEVKLTNWKTINLEELYKEYNKLYSDFKTKNKVFEFGNKQLSKSENGFWFNDAKYWLWYDQLEKAYEDKIQDVEKMWVTDLVIMLRVLFWIVPVAWDFDWWINDLRQAKSWINFDWSIQWIPENLLGYLTGALWVSIVWWKIATVLKWEKLAKVMVTMNKVIDRLWRLPDLWEIAKNEKIMWLLEGMKGIIPNVKELLDKVKWKQTRKLENAEWKITKEQLSDKEAKSELISKSDNFDTITDFPLKDKIDNLEIWDVVVYASWMEAKVISIEGDDINCLVTIEWMPDSLITKKSYFYESKWIYLKEIRKTITNKIGIKDIEGFVDWNYSDLALKSLQKLIDNNPNLWPSIRENFTRLVEHNYLIKSMFSSEEWIKIFYFLEKYPERYEWIIKLFVNLWNDVEKSSWFYNMLLENEPILEYIYDYTKGNTLKLEEIIDKMKDVYIEQLTNKNVKNINDFLDTIRLHQRTELLVTPNDYNNVLNCLKNINKDNPELWTRISMDFSRIASWNNLIYFNWLWILLYIEKYPERYDWVIKLLNYVSNDKNKISGLTNIMSLDDSILESLFSLTWKDKFPSFDKIFDEIVKSYKNDNREDMKQLILDIKQAVINSRNKVPKISPEKSLKLVSSKGDKFELSKEFLNSQDVQKVLNLPQEFSSRKGLQYIKTLPREEKLIVMELWKKKLKNQLDLLASLPIKFIEQAEKYDYINSNKEYILKDLVNKYIPFFEKLSFEQREQVLIWMERYINRKFLVHKYTELPKYKNNPKLLVADALNTNVSKLKWNVTMEIDSANFSFFIENDEDYKLLRAWWNEKKALNSTSSWWVSFQGSMIEELKWTITIINWKKTNENLSTKLHETTHANNHFIMSDHFVTSLDNLSRAKDEIIAYLKDWDLDIIWIKNLLLRKWEKELYDYYEEYNSLPIYNKLKILYEQELKVAIGIALKIEKANIPNYLDLLAITPVRQWGMLYDIYLK